VLDTFKMIEERSKAWNLSGALFGISSLAQAICGIRPGDLCSKTTLGQPVRRVAPAGHPPVSEKD
jgi:hypothetical protein